MQRLPATVVVDARPRRDRPDVVQLPDNRAHAAPAVAPPVLHAVANCLRLHQLGGIQQVVEAVRIAERLREVGENLAVCRLIALVALHYAAEDIAVVRQGELLDRFQAREGLKAEFRRIAEEKLAVLREGLFAVPDVPIVVVAAVFVVRGVEIAAGGRRRGPPVRLRRGFLHYCGQNVLEHLHIVGDVVRIRRHELPRPMVDERAVCARHEHLHLVVAANQRQRRMMAQARDILMRLHTNRTLKIRREVIESTGVHQILPDQQAQLVTDVIERIVRVIPAAPDADGVEIRRLAVLQEPARPLRRHARQNVVLRNVVRAHRKHLHAVDDVAELLAPFVLFAADGHRAQTNAPHARIARRQTNRHAVQRLFAQPVRPPQLRILDSDNLLRRRRFGDDHHFAIRRGDFRRPRAFTRNFRADGHVHHAVMVRLQHQRVFQPRRIPRPQENQPPDARVRQTGSPVPAEHAVCLAQVAEAGRCVGGFPAGRFFSFFRTVENGGIKSDFQRVFARVQLLLHVPHPGDVHVVREGDFAPVKRHMRQRIQPLADQLHMRMCQLCFSHGECALVHIIFLHALEGIQLVFAPERVRHRAIRHQIRIHAARHMRRMPRFAVCFAHPPRAAEVHLFRHWFHPPRGNFASL